MEGEHRLRERVELSLDNRQIFLLFVVSAVVVSVVFALGVVVGKRLVSTTPPAVAPTDPLALLDQLGQVGSEPPDDKLTFHEALTETKGDPPNKAAKKAAAAKAELKPKERPAPRAKPSVDKKKTARVAKDAPAPAKPAPARPKDKPKPAKEAKATATAPTKPKSPPKAKKPGAKAAGQRAAKGGYTLQLSSFQDKTEAERFMETLRAKGLRPHIVPAQIPDRGVWYRVRVGSYRSWDEAVAAKEKFERTEQVIAYVARAGS